MTDLTNTPEPALGPVLPAGGWGTRDDMTTLTANRHPSTAQYMRYFAFAHLAGSLRSTSEPFAALARHLLETLPDGPALTTALSKLVDAKDAAVRASVDMLAG